MDFNIRFPRPPSPAAPPSRKIIRVQSPVGDDGPAVDIEVIERLQPKYPPTFKEVVIRPQTSSRPEYRILLPEDLHPALVESYIIKVAYKAMEQEREETWSEMEKAIQEQRKIGYNTALKLVLDTCTIPVPDITDELGQYELSLESKQFLTSLLTGEPPKTTFPQSWTPPPYDEVDDRLAKMCRENVVVVLGALNGDEIYCGMDGEVECIDLFHCTGEAVLTIKMETGEKSVEVQVLGAVCGRDVAVLLDKIGNIWLYNVPGAVDRRLKNFQPLLAMVLRAGETAYVDKELVLHECYDEVEVELVDP